MGKVQIDHTGSGGGITLSSDGTNLLLGGTAIGGGGGGADLYAANESSPQAQPSATGTNAVAIGDDAVASGERSFAAMLDSEASGTQSIAIGRNALSSGSLATAIGYAAKSAGSQSVALGQAYASGTESFAAVIDNNTSSYGATANNSVAIGYLAKATATHSFASGVFAEAGTNAVALGRDATATGSGSIAVRGDATNTYTIAIGQAAVASGGESMAIGNTLGQATTASADRSIAIGVNTTASGSYSQAYGYSGKAETTGKIVFSGRGDFSNVGAYQQGLFILRSQTTDATAEALTVDDSTASATNQINLPNNSAYAFSGTIVARQQAADGTACAAWKVEGLIRREANAGTTVLVNSATTVLDNTPNWGMALSADTTNGCLKVQVTGAASTDIRWVATIHTSEVTYA